MNLICIMTAQGNGRYSLFFVGFDKAVFSELYQTIKQ